MHRIYLHQLYFLLHQIMHQWLCIWPGRLKSYHYFLYSISLPCLTYSLPHLFILFSSIENHKRFFFPPIRTSNIYHMLLLRYIERHYQGFPIDFLPLLWLNIFHSYTPFFDLNFSNLLLHSIQERVLLFFPQSLTTFYIIASLVKGAKGVVMRSRRSLR